MYVMQKHLKQIFAPFCAKKLSFCHKLWFSIFQIFATKLWLLLHQIFKVLNIKGFSCRLLSDIGIRTFDFSAKTHFHCFRIPWTKFLTWFWSLTFDDRELEKSVLFSFKNWKWVFVTNSYFLNPKSLQPKVV